MDLCEVRLSFATFDGFIRHFRIVDNAEANMNSVRKLEGRIIYSNGKSPAIESRRVITTHHVH